MNHPIVRIYVWQKQNQRQETIYSHRTFQVARSICQTVIFNQRVGLVCHQGICKRNSVRTQHDPYIKQSDDFSQFKLLVHLVTQLNCQVSCWYARQPNTTSIKHTLHCFSRTVRKPWCHDSTEVPPVARLIDDDQLVRGQDGHGFLQWPVEQKCPVASVHVSVRMHAAHFRCELAGGQGEQDACALALPIANLLGGDHTGALLAKPPRRAPASLQQHSLSCAENWHQSYTSVPYIRVTPTNPDQSKVATTTTAGCWPGRVDRKLLWHRRLREGKLSAPWPFHKWSSQGHHDPLTPAT